MGNISAKYGYKADVETISRNIGNISKSLDDISSPEVLKKCFGLMDLTSLHTDDTDEKIKKLVGKVNSFRNAYPSYPLPASICVYPCFAGIVKAERAFPELDVTCVAGCFPTSQSYIDVKLLEIEEAIAEGADEIDTVLNLRYFMAGDYAKAGEEIAKCRERIDSASEKAGRKVVFKVILETGLLVSPDLIADASFLAMENGADFIKTSTGKVSVNATPTAAYIMCECIGAFFKKTGKMVGFKAAGGISTAAEALSYWAIVKSVLGTYWLDKDHFRFGVSRLANNLMTAIEQKTVTIF